MKMKEENAVDKSKCVRRRTSGEDFALFTAKLMASSIVHIFLSLRTNAVAERESHINVFE